MKKTYLLILGALPGAALGYAVLMGYLLKRVKPLPITLPPETQPANKRGREAVPA